MRRLFPVLPVACLALILLAWPKIAWPEDDTVTWQAVNGDRDVDADTELTTEVEQTVLYTLEKIVVKGNRKTLRTVILRYLAIKPGDVFAAEDSSLEESRYRMLASGLFRDVTFELEKGSARGFVILKINISERNTIVINDLTFGITQILPNYQDLVLFGSIGVLERSFLGTGIELGATLAASNDQKAYRIYWRDNHFLNSRFGLHVEGLFADAQEYFGQQYLQDRSASHINYNDEWEVIKYRRAAIRLGTGYNLLRDYFFWCDFRFENIKQDEPLTARLSEVTERSSGDYSADAYMEPDDSVLTSALFGFTRDTTNHPVLPSEGARTQLSVELSHPILGSDYDFVKFVLNHQTLFPFGKKGQSIGIAINAGLISGSAPFFDQFFVGDYFDLVPDRQLGLNFTNLHPSILNTSIEDMWYEDLVLSLSAEWSRPIYRSNGSLYGINLFVRLGAFALTSTEHLDGHGFPVDVTGDFGVRVDTSVGVFTFSFAAVTQLIPPVRRETTE